MTLLERFHSALVSTGTRLPGPELLPERLARATAQVLPVDGAGISVFFLSDRRVPLGASGPDAAEAERLQFTLGQGPCLTSHAEDRVVVGDETTMRTRWPHYHEALLARTPIRGTISIPLGDGLRGTGALDLYLVPPRAPAAVDLDDARTVAGEVAALLQAPHPQVASGDGPVWLDAPAADSRATVWQALGWLNAALGLDSPDALAVLRARAHAADSTLEEIARQVLDRELPTTDLVLDQDTPR